MCNCKNLRMLLTVVEAERVGLISNHHDVDQGKITVFSTGVLGSVAEAYGCCLYQCAYCGQKWDAVLFRPYFLRAANKTWQQLSKHERSTDLDPDVNRGVVLRKQSLDEINWHQEMERLYYSCREPALERKKQEYLARGYQLSSDLRESWWDLVVLYKQISRKRFLGEDLLQEKIWLFVDIEGKLMCEEILSQGLETLVLKRYAA